MTPPAWTRMITVLTSMTSKYSNQCKTSMYSNLFAY